MSVTKSRLSGLIAMKAHAFESLRRDVDLVALGQVQVKRLSVRERDVMWCQFLCKDGCRYQKKKDCDACESIRGCHLVRK
jgi:hypothetical protein